MPDSPPINNTGVSGASRDRCQAAGPSQLTARPKPARNGGQSRAAAKRQQAGRLQPLVFSRTSDLNDLTGRAGIAGV
jgi:hypothetical protein